LLTVNDSDPDFSLAERIAADTVAGRIEDPPSVRRPGPIAGAISACRWSRSGGTLSTIAPRSAEIEGFPRAARGARLWFSLRDQSSYRGFTPAFYINRPNQLR